MTTTRTTITLPVFGIEVTLNGAKGGVIATDLHEDGGAEHEAAIDAIESLILAHAVAGVDISQPNYIEGLKTAVEAVANNF